MLYTITMVRLDPIPSGYSVVITAKSGKSIINGPIGNINYSPDSDNKYSATLTDGDIGIPKIKSDSSLNAVIEELLITNLLTTPVLCRLRTATASKVRYLHDNGRFENGKVITTLLDVICTIASNEDYTPVSTIFDVLDKELTIFEFTTIHEDGFRQVVPNTFCSVFNGSVVTTLMNKYHEIQLLKLDAFDDCKPLLNKTIESLFN